MIKKYFNICKKNRKVLYVFLGVLLVLGILNLVIPIYTSKIIDYLTIKNFDRFIKATIIISLLFLITNLFSFFACKLYSVFFRETFINVHKMIISKLYDYNDELINIPKGKIISTVNIDAINIAEMADYMFNVIFNMALIICMLIFFVKTSLILGIMLLFVVTIYIILVNKLTKKSSFYMREQRNYQDKLTNLLSQMLNGIREIKTFNMRSGLNKKYDELRRGWARKYMLKRKYVIAHDVTLKYIMYASGIILYIISAYLLFDNKITIGIIVLLINYFNNIFSYASELVSDVATVRNYNISLDRVCALLESTSNYIYGAVNNNHIHGHVSFKNVSFSYKDKPTIKNISFEVHPNKITVIIGKTGSGKSTLFNILLRLHKPDKGCVYIDDIKIDEYTKDVYYKNVSVVGQESFLFNISIKDNLSMVNKDINKQIEVCKRVGIHNLIVSLPKGYNTILSENASNLSGGQKRLLSLAKTLLTGAKILLFDEVTSSLDPKTTKEISNVLKSLKQDHTIIIITHKKEIMNIADELILLDNGKIVEKGKYNNLSNSKYFKDLINNEENKKNESYFEK